MENYGFTVKIWYECIRIIQSLVETCHPELDSGSSHKLLKIIYDKETNVPLNYVIFKCNEKFFKIYFPGFPIKLGMTTLIAKKKCYFKISQFQNSKFQI